jgi:methylphosphotriester-DNA--protein-cysteine methyltransferase
MLYAWQTRDERSSKFWKRCIADNDEQADTVQLLIRLIANAAIVRKRNPAALADGCEPYLVGRVRRKVVRVSLDRQTVRSKNLGEAFAEIAIGEIDKVQATRS